MSVNAAPPIAQRFFLAGCALTALFAVGHALGFAMAYRAARHDPGMAELTRAMREKRFRVGGMEPSILDFREYFSASFSLLLAGLVAVNLIAFTSAGGSATVLLRLAAANAVMMVALVALSWRFSVFQGIITAATIALLHATALWTVRRAG